MKSMRSGIAALLVLAACSGEADTPTAAPETETTIAPGGVVGFVAENGAHVWRGVPFAASTGGENRWRAPQPAPGWEGVRPALQFAERCAQLTNEYDEDEGLEPGLAIGSEDCLALDVYAPSGARSGPLPVMVWIHGGGNVWGRSGTYDVSRLAQNEDVVVVAVQYRLGPLGWFSHHALRASARTPEEAGACFTTLDLVASLGWVRENIAAFGGDPDNVTIFGESAGGHNVVTLLASPLARGLFHRAIIQSGSFDSVTAAEAEGDAGEVANPAKAIAAKLDASTADALRAVSVEELLGVYERKSGFLDAPRVIQDGVALPATPLREAFSSTGTWNRVPIMTGTTRDEMKLFYLRDASLTKARLGVFPVARDPDLYDALTGYISRLWRIRSVDEPAAAMSAAGHDAVYAYRFDWDDGGRLLFTDFKTLLGAAHGFDIPFVFNRFHHLGGADFVLFKDETREDRERLSRVMGGLWASFAREGVPSHPDAPAWPTYTRDDPAFLRLDTDNDGGIEVVRAADDLDALATDLMTDPRVDGPERCLIVEEMGKWMFSRGIHPRLESATGCER